MVLRLHPKASIMSLSTAAGPGQIPKISIMEAQLENNKKPNYVHYDHTDSCRFSRWTAKECYQYMYGRPWEKVNHFYSEMVQGRVSLSSLFKKEADNKELLLLSHATHIDSKNTEDHSKAVRAANRTGRWARVTFKVLLSYHGGSFDGWQKQPGLNTVQGIVERSLGNFVDEKKSQLLKEKNLPVEGCAMVAGRTDKGVTAFQQVCAFYTWRKDVKPQDIEDAINRAAPGKMMVISVAVVSREFHPNFSAKWRRYLYIFPFNDGEEGVEKDANESRGLSGQPLHGNLNSVKHNELNDYENEMETGKKPTMFEVSKVDRLLRELEGRLLSYKMFARDTKASRNFGPPTECFMFHARAMGSSLHFTQDGTSTKIMCVELVANRFLRKMVRVVVATAIREAAAGAEDDALLKLMDASCRRATAPPSPPDGLCLVDVGYTDFDPKICLIS